MRYAVAWIVLLPWCANLWAEEEAQDFARIEAAVVDYVMAHTDPHTRYEITLNPLDARLRLPVCGRAIEVFASPGYRPMGTATLGVRCNQDRSWVVYVSAHIKAFRRVAVLTSAVMRGTPIKPGDIVLRELDVSSLSSGYFFDEQYVVGKLAKRSLNAGMVISPNELSAPRWVARGQVVTLYVDSDGLQVRAQGEAMGDGAENDLVKVRNALSGKVVDGFVTAPGTVRVKM
jgi:flagella basal body P-ring formation protein FlgA